MTEVQRLAKIKVLKDLLKEYELLAKYNGGTDYDRYCALDMAIKSLEQEPKPNYKSFCEWVANEIFTEDWDLNKDAFAEIACRKLSKLGIVASEGDVWKLREGEVQK